MIRNEAPIYKKDDEKEIFKIKSAAAKQRLRLERLMSDPVAEMLNTCGVISSETVAETVATLQSSSQSGEKPHAKLNKVVVIPERPKDHAPKAPPEFIRNIWGSSAGVGSGDFHIYRGIRRREYARQKYNTFMKEKEERDKKYDEKLKMNAEKGETKTAKKRAKRLKQKERLKRKRQQKKQGEESSESEQESTSSEGEHDEGLQPTSEQNEGAEKKQPVEDHQENVDTDKSNQAPNERPPLDSDSNNSSSDQPKSSEDSNKSSSPESHEVSSSS